MSFNLPMAVFTRRSPPCTTALVSPPPVMPHASAANGLSTDHGLFSGIASAAAALAPQETAPDVTAAACLGRGPPPAGATRVRLTKLGAAGGPGAGPRAPGGPNGIIEAPPCTQGLSLIHISEP